MSTAAERKNFIWGAKHCDDCGFTSLPRAADSELSLQGCPSPGTCCRQAKNQGLEAPKGKKGAWAGNKAKKPSCNRHQAPPLRGCRQGLLLPAGHSGQQVSNRRGQRAGKIQDMWLRGQHTRKKTTTCIFCALTLCVNAWKVDCNWKEGKLHLSLRTTMSSTFNYISALVNNPPWWISYLWTIGMFLCDANDWDHSYECEWFINLLVYKKVIQNHYIPFHWEDLIP